MSTKRITMIIAAIAVVTLGVLLLMFNADTTNTRMPVDTNSKSTAETFTPQPSELLIGSSTAPAVIVEYADFKCPSCGQFHQTTAKQLKEAYPDNLKIVFRPIALIGPDSERAAIGAYCAADQGKFVQYHDTVFDYMWDNYYEDRQFAVEYEDVLTADVLSDIGKTIALEERAFSSCLADDDKKEQVATNMELAQQAGIKGTPTFVIADRVIAGPQPFNVFKSLVDLQI